MHWFWSAGIAAAGGAAGPGRAALVLLAMGGCLSLVNFYLSFLNYPVHRLLNKPYQFVSGIPLFGSLLLVLAALMCWHMPVLFWLAVALAVLDTGGLHWFAASVLWMRLRHPASITGLCPKCSRDVRGITEPRCPECGERI